ncbi:MAG: cyclase family protein [Gammaproteobacteria bacterium]|nr:cyclase family protein [Gammaproteobacteria bacterium]
MHFRFASGALQWALTGRVHDLAIPLLFDGPQPSYFGAGAASAAPMHSGDFVGDTRQGGSCNAVDVQLNPHCNGTHTECVGHLTEERISVTDAAPALPLLAQVISVTPSPRGAAGEHCITRTATETALQRFAAADIRALVVRTLPNSDAKLTRAYHSARDCPYFTTGAISLMVDRGIEHLLVDTPSIDKYDDGGRLAAHRCFFGLPEFDEKKQVGRSDATRGHATITEMVYVPDTVADGIYLLNLHVPAFVLDAAPSRPLLYELEMQ